MIKAILGVILVLGFIFSGCSDKKSKEDIENQKISKALDNR